MTYLPIALGFSSALKWELNANIIQPMVTTGSSDIGNLISVKDVLPFSK